MDVRYCPKCSRQLYQSVPFGTDLLVFKCQSCNQYWANDEDGGLITLDKVPPHKHPFFPHGQMQAKCENFIQGEERGHTPMIVDAPDRWLPPSSN